MGQEGPQTAAPAPSGSRTSKGAWSVLREQHEPSDGPEACGLK